MTTPLQQAALDYLCAGLHLLALTGKKPNGRVHGEQWSWDDSFHGDPATEAEWEAVGTAFSEQSGTTGIAILVPEGFLVADVDTDRAADALLATGWEASDDSIVAQTKNGLHVWFYAPEATGNRWLGDGRVEDFPDNRALLFKGLGGYVVAPPSLHLASDGSVDGSYTWVRPLLSPEAVRYFPDISPEKVRDLFRAGDQYKDTLPEKEAMTYWTLKPAEGVPWYLWEKVWDYQTAGLERAIETAADGNQNNIIHWAAMTCREEGVPLDVAMERLLAAALKGGHPRQRARDTIRGAYKRALRG